MAEENETPPIGEVGEVEKAAVEALFPKCPYCGADPVNPQWRQLNIGRERAVIFFCDKCRATLPVFALPPVQPPRPSIVPPGGMVPRIIKPQ